MIAGRQSLSSSKMERHTVPEGYTFGWNNGGSNLPDKEEEIICIQCKDEEQRVGLDQ